MIKPLTLSAATLLGLLLLSLGGCTCGFDCSSDNDSQDPNNPSNDTLFTLGFSDAPAENLQEVVIEVSKITLTRSSGEDEVIENFTIPRLNGVKNDPSFQVNLLNYQGTEQLEVITDRETPADTYTNIIIEINTDSSNNSYVMDETGLVLPLLVTGNTLTLSGIALLEAEEIHTIEFNLERSLRYESVDKVYRLGDEGLRTIENKDLVVLEGSLDETLFNEGDCRTKDITNQGNRVYLYEGVDITNKLGDVFDEAAADAPADVAAPYAVGRLIEPQDDTEGWRYEFGFLAEGEYTIAFSCNAGGDDPEDYDADDITIPYPEDQRYPVTLDKDEPTYCDIDEKNTCLDLLN